MYWYRKASQQNHARAQDKMAVHLQNGIGVRQNLELAFDLFERAAENNHVAAQFHLANCFEKGLGCPVDLGKATIWFERAAMGKTREKTNSSLITSTYIHFHFSWLQKFT